MHQANQLPSTLKARNPPTYTASTCSSSGLADVGVELAAERHAVAATVHSSGVGPTTVGSITVLERV